MTDYKEFVVEADASKVGIGGVCPIRSEDTTNKSLTLANTSRKQKQTIPHQKESF